jgi:hypothetical protein
VVDIRALDFRVDLSPEECWRLYVWLEDDAPFVRNQLSVVRHGGGRDVSLSTPEERRQVRNAIVTGGRDSSALTDGLRSLRTALGESEG